MGLFGRQRPSTRTAEEDRGGEDRGGSGQSSRNKVDTSRPRRGGGGSAECGRAERMYSRQDSFANEEEKIQVEEALRESMKEPRQARTAGASDDLEYAMALSLAEEERRKGGGPSPRPDKTSKEKEQLKRDEDLARRLQEQLDASNNFSPPDSRRYPTTGSDPSSLGVLDARPPPVDASALVPLPSSGPSLFVSPFVRGCPRCKQPIGYGRYLNCLGRSWHPDCFRCKACDEPIREHQFSVAMGDPYHTDCHKKLFQPKCHVCKDYIPANSSGLIEYRSHPFWGDKYCPAHETDRTPRCCGCERLEAHDVQFADLDDGRKLCLECCGTVIVDTNDAQPLITEVLNFYRSIQMPIRQNIPILLVERQALNAAQQGEKDGRHHHPETRGLCLSEEQTIRTVVRRPHSVAGAALGMMGSSYQTVRRHCEVTAILMLYGLPRLLTGSILAHELMHAWLRLDGSFPKLSPDVEEGICQVMAHLWLQKQAVKKTSDAQNGNGGGSSSSSTTTSRWAASSSQAARSRGDGEKRVSGEKDRLVDFFLHQIMKDSSPIYGGGFRAANAAVAELGLQRTLDHIRLAGAIPEGKA